MFRLKLAWLLLRGHTVVYRAEIKGDLIVRDPKGAVVENTFNGGGIYFL